MIEMIIAIDLDDTFTLDETFWTAFVLSAQKKGYTVLLVTLRHTREGLCYYAKLFGDDFIFNTGGEQKAKFLRDNHDLIPDVWIDDSPETIK